MTWAALAAWILKVLQALSVSAAVWLVLIGGLVVVAWAWPAAGVPAILLGIWWWTLTCLIHNAIAIHHPHAAAGVSARSKATLQQQAWLSSPVLLGAPVAFFLGLQSPRIDVFWLTLAIVVVSVVATAAGHDVDAPDLPHGSLARTALMRRILQGFSMPPWLTQSKQGRFPPVLVIGWAALTCSAFGFAMPAWTETPRTLIRNVIPHLNEEADAKRTSGRDEADEPPPPPEPLGEQAASPPAECEPTRMIEALTVGWQLPTDVATRVVSAQRTAAWPIVGCDVSVVSQFGTTTYVTYSGSEATGLAVDDGDTANLAVSYTADLLIDGDFQLFGSGRVVRLGPYLRAGVGRWQAAELQDRTCSAILTPDDGRKAYALTVQQTTAVTDAATRLEGFPMARATSGSEASDVDIFVVDDRSPNGFRRQQTISLSSVDSATPSPQEGCTETVKVLRRLGADLEQAAVAARD